VDEEGARALLLGHARLGAPPQLLAALCQIYAVNGGAAKRAPNFRAGLQPQNSRFCFFLKKKKKLCCL
jgi:hypothetical protein